MSKCKLCDAEEHPAWKAHVFLTRTRPGIKHTQLIMSNKPKRKKAKRR